MKALHIPILFKKDEWDEIVSPDLPGSDQWTTSIYSKHASAIVNGTDTSFQWSKSAECSTGQSRGRQQGLFCCWT